MKSENILDLAELYQAAFSKMPYLSYLLDKDARLVMCNDRLRELIGAECIAAEASLYPCLITALSWSEERVARLKKDDIEALVSGEPHLDVIEPPIVQPDGYILYFHAHRTPLYNAKQKVIGCLVVLVDVTQEQALEQALFQAKAALQKENASATMAPKSPYRPQKLTQPEVLLIEDNTLAQKAGQALLMQLDCKVTVADSLETMKEAFKPGKFDIVFMDIGLQETSGYVLSKCIRSLEQNTPHHVPIIALTGYEAEVVKHDCNDYFMEGAITKPLTTEQAKQIIQHYVYHIDIPVNGLKTV